ncbi:hypothetical protein ACIQZG_18700 [Lysinibacillus sp. NPDC096418]
MKSKNEMNNYELRKEASEMKMSSEELSKLKSLIRGSEEKRTNQVDKNQK